MQSAEDESQLSKWWQQAPVTIFCSCALRDESLLEQLELHLRTLEQAGALQVWSFRHLSLGADKTQQMEGYLRSSALILLLLSADFFASEECLNQMVCALARHKSGEARLIPIPLRPVVWQQTPLASYASLPSNGQAVTEWTNLDAAFENIVQGVLHMLSYLGRSLLALSNAPTTHIHLASLYPLPSDSSETLQDSFEVSTTGKQHWRSIEGRQPPTDPRTIVQREKIVRQVYEHLTQPNVTAVAITGMSGSGKSTLAGLVYNYAEEQRKIGVGLFTARAIWLTIDSSVTLRDLAGTLCKHLDVPFVNIQFLAPRRMAIALCNAMSTVEHPRLIILDEFQHLFVSPSSQMEHPGIREWLDLLNSQPCICRVLLTCSFYPQGLHNYPSTYLQEYCLSSLNALEGQELLYKQGITRTPDIDEEEVHLAVKTCQGHVQALVLLASLLRDDRSLNLAALLHDPSYGELWMGDIAHNLLDRIYSDQLSEQQRCLLRGFSLYREPVPLEAVQEFLPKISLKKTLHGLLALHLLQAVGALRYQLHPIVSAYARKHFVEGDDQANRQALQVAHVRAAEYYQRQAIAICPPHEKRQSLSDIQPLVEACWHLCQGQQQQAAFALMEQEALFTSLELLGGGAFLYELCQLLLSSDQWQPLPLQAGFLYARLASLCNALGQKDEALKYFVRALMLYRQLGDRREEIVILNSLGSVCTDLGNREDACKYIGEALTLSKEIGNREEEAMVLNNLGKIYSQLGKREEALNYYQQALKMMQTADNQRGEGVVLNNLGKVYGDLGKLKEALGYYQLALDRRRQLADRWGEGITLNNLGGLYDEWGNKEEALRYYQLALEIKRRLTDRWGEGVTLHNMGRLYDEWGNKEEALHWYQAALHIRKKLGDSLGEATTLNNLGGIYNMMGKMDEAQQYYERALYLERNLGDLCGEGVTLHNLGRLHNDLNYYYQALLIRRLVGDRKGEGMTLHNVGVLYFEQEHYDVALASLILAKTIFEKIRSPNQYTSQKKIYQLRRKLGIQYQALETSVKIRAIEIVDQALREKRPPHI